MACDKLKALIIINIQLLIIIAIMLNVNSIALHEDDESNTILNQKNELRSTRDSHWGSIKVISEPIFGQNLNNRYSGHADIAVENDKVYVVWQDEQNYNASGTDRDIFFRYFDGSLWSEIQVISEPVVGQNLNNYDSWMPRIAVEDGKIYVVWWDMTNLSNSGGSEIFFRCNITGSNWEDIQVISEPIEGQDINNGAHNICDLAIENGNVYIVWSGAGNETNNAGSDGDIFLRCNLTKTHWEPIQLISEPILGQDINDQFSWYPRIEVENENIYVVWRDQSHIDNAGLDPDIFYRCNIKGVGWGDIQAISEPILGPNFNNGNSTAPDIAVENGKIYVVWQDTNDTNHAGSDEDIFYRCNLTGTSWESVQVISEPLEGLNLNKNYSWFPSIAVTDDKIYVVWGDAKPITYPDGYSDIFYISNLTGFNWEPIQVVSEPLYNGSTLYPIIEVASNKCHLVWQDCNNTNGAGEDSDIFYRSRPLNLALSSCKVIPVTGNTSTNFNFSVIYFNYNDMFPTEIYVNISGTDYPIFELDPSDTNCFNGKKYHLEINHLNIGEHNYHFWASDGINTNTTATFDGLLVYNTPPRIITENIPITFEDTYYEVDYEHIDIDLENIGQVSTWSLESNATWLTINQTTGIFSGTPTNDDVGYYWVNIIVNDTIHTNSTYFTLDVLDVNDNPIINTTNEQITYEDKLYKVDYNATDIDSPLKDQTWTLNTSAGSWLDIDGFTGIISGIPTNDDVGEYWVNVSVNDSEGGICSSNFSLTVLNVNDPPVIITDDITKAIINEMYFVDYNATDIDTPGSELVWSIITHAKWLDIDPYTGVLNGTPTINDLGYYDVKVIVDDRDGGIDWHEFILNVIKGKTNKPPVISTQDVDTAEVNKFYEVDYDATDDRTPIEDLFWDLKTNGSWLNLNSYTGVLSGTPTMNDVGWYWVNVSVTDLEYGWAYHNFTLRVNSPIIINHQPILSNPMMNPSEGYTNTDFFFTVHYYDTDSEPPALILLVIDNKNYDLELKSGENPFNGTYKCSLKLSKGPHTYYFIASDGTYIVITQKFTTPSIIEVQGGLDRGSESREYFWIFIILIIIFLIIISTIIYVRKKRREKHEKEELPSTSSPGAWALSKASREFKERSYSIPGGTPLALTSSTAAVTAPFATSQPWRPQSTLPTPIGPQMIGRENELNQLLAYLDKVELGEGNTVFITGEAGIGKTRLVDELKDLARIKGFLTLTGNCIYESMTPYQPILEALKSKNLDYLFSEEVPRVEAVYLMTHTGLLIKEVVRQESKLDSNLFAAMLFTVSNFVTESLSMLLGGEKEGTLNTLGYEDYRILIESGSNTNLVIIISGKENEFLINDVREIFVQLNTRYGEVLKNWDRTEKSILGIDIILQPLITSGKYDGLSYGKLDLKTRRDMLFENVSLGLNRHTQTTPTLLVIEDLQWSDPSSLSLMSHIARNNRKSKLIIIGTYRPEDVTGGEKRHPLIEILQLMDRNDLYQELKLERLPEECIPEFLTFQLGQTDLTDEFKSRIYSETEGNPLFIIQLIKFLVEEKIIKSEDNVWKLARDIEKIDIPSKIYNVIVRRLDRLEKEHRKLLDYASVVGYTFESSILTSALKRDRVWLLEQLKELEKTHRLIHSLNGKFKFDHEKIKEVLYTEIPTELKMEYHAIIAGIIETQNKDNLDAVVGELAFHYYQCKNKEKALHYIIRAADKAKKSYSNEEAIKFYYEALEFEEDNQRKVEIFESVGDINYLIKNFDASIESYSNALRSAVGNKKAELMAKLGGIFERSGKYDESLKLCNEALALVRGQNSKEEALTLQNMGNVLLFRKEYKDALNSYEKSLEIRTKLGDEQGIAACYNNIGLVYYGKGEYNKALENLEKSLEIRSRIGDQEGVASTMSNLGTTHEKLGDLEKAKNFYSQSQDIRAKIGDPSSIMHSISDPRDVNFNHRSLNKNSHFSGTSGGG